MIVRRLTAGLALAAVALAPLALGAGPGRRPQTIATAAPGGFITVRQADGTFKRVQIPGDTRGVPPPAAGSSGTGGFVRVKRPDGTYAQVPIEQSRPVDARAQAVEQFQALVQSEIDAILTAHALAATSANRAMAVDAAERAARNSGAGLLELLACAKGNGGTGATVEESMRRCGALIRVKKNRASRK